MSLAPFGELHDEYKGRLRGLYSPPENWPDGQEAVFKTELSKWLDQVKDAIWPAWEGGVWVGDAATNMEAATRAELSLAVQLYHGGGDAKGVLAEIPQIPHAPDGRPRDHEWHYKIEDALILDTKDAIGKIIDGEQPSFEYRASRSIGSNYLVYDPGFDNGQFDGLGGMFWKRMRSIEPPIWDIKQHLQRPRPWTAATGLGVDGFRWVVAGGFYVTHTGVHPSLLSGHCIQGILGGCNVFDSLLSDNVTFDGDRKRALQKYMVDWGDRRVFAGVHYMTDNIGSWTLARRLIPYLFRNPDEVEALAVEAISQHSRVCQDIIKHFPADSPAKEMLLEYFPESASVV